MNSFATFIIHDIDKLLYIPLLVVAIVNWKRQRELRY